MEQNSTATASLGTQDWVLASENYAKRATAASAATDSASSPRDERLSFAPLTFEDALKGLLISTEISADAEESESIRRAQKQVDEGDVRWLDDEETVSQAIDSDLQEKSKTD